MPRAGDGNTPRGKETQHVRRSEGKMMRTVGIALSIVGWVTVMNPAGIRNGNGTFDFGDACAIQSTKQVEPVTTSAHGMLYRIAATRAPAYGSLCPTGTLFFMQPEAFQALREKEEAATQTQQQLQQDVKGLLK
jgi:hypothetical protein